MVDVEATNAKLIERQKHFVIISTKSIEQQQSKLLLNVIIIMKLLSL